MKISLMIKFDGIRTYLIKKKEAYESERIANFLLLVGGESLNPSHWTLHRPVYRTCLLIVC